MINLVPGKLYEIAINRYFDNEKRYFAEEECFYGVYTGVCNIHRIKGSVVCQFLVGNKLEWHLSSNIKTEILLNEELSL